MGLACGTVAEERHSTSVLAAPSEGAPGWQADPLIAVSKRLKVAAGLCWKAVARRIRKECAQRSFYTQKTSVPFVIIADAACIVAASRSQCVRGCLEATACSRRGHCIWLSWVYAHEGRAGRCRQFCVPSRPQSCLSGWPAGAPVRLRGCAQVMHCFEATVMPIRMACRSRLVPARRCTGALESACLRTGHRSQRWWATAPRMCSGIAPPSSLATRACTRACSKHVFSTWHTMRRLMTMEGY